MAGEDLNCLKKKKGKKMEKRLKMGLKLNSTRNRKGLECVKRNWIATNSSCFYLKSLKKQLQAGGVRHRVIMLRSLACCRIENEVTAAVTLKMRRASWCVNN